MRDAEPLLTELSSEDELALGAEASSYGHGGVKTVQEFLWWSRSGPSISRWNSFNSSVSGQSVPVSVMDFLNLWNDDPEELLLDLGFGCDEPDLSGRIPARFINHQSQARGINLQVFLEAQKNRLDLENPDVSNRFRQLEVLQQVTTAFSSLVSSTPLKAAPGPGLSAEARERRKRVGMLFRRASKKWLSQNHNHMNQEVSVDSRTCVPGVGPETAESSPGPEDHMTPVNGVKPGLKQAGGLSPLEEEPGPGPHSDHESTIQEGAPSVERSPRQAGESFEMEEVHSFDESSVTGSATAGADSVRGVVRANSVQSDSSGFLEEPFVPSSPPETSPRPALIKVLLSRSRGVPDRPPQTSPVPPPSTAEDSLLHSPPFLMKPERTDMDSQPVSVDRCSDCSTPQLQTSLVSPPASPTSVRPPYCPSQPASVTSASEDVPPQDKDTSSPVLPTHSFDSDRTSTTMSHSVSIPTRSPPPTSDKEAITQGSEPPQEDPTLSAVHSWSPLVPLGSSAESPTQSPEERPLPPSDPMEMEKKERPSSSVSHGQGTEPSCICFGSSEFDPLVPLHKSMTSLASGRTDVVIDPAVEPSSSQQDACVSPVHDVIHVVARDLKGLQRNQDQSHGDAIQTQGDVDRVNTGSSAGQGSERLRLGFEEERSKIGTDPQVPSEMYEELSTEPEHMAEVEIDRKGNQHDASCETASGSDLVEIESLDQVFETSVDGSEGDYGDVDAFFQELDSAGHAYWAEPVQVSDGTPQSGSFEASEHPPGDVDVFSSSVASPPDADSSSSPHTATVMPSSSSDQRGPAAGTVHSGTLTATTPEHKPSSPSVSVQMSSAPSSHIVQRKDVPFMSDSKHRAVPRRLRLDTSTPFRAVQSWTDLRIHQKTPTNQRPHGGSHMFPHTGTVSTGTVGLTHTPARMSLSSPSVPLLSDDWRSNYPTLSMSVDTGLCCHGAGTGDRRDNEDNEDRAWQDGGQMSFCCDHQCICCPHHTYNRQPPLANIPYSLHELEELIVCLQQFRAVLSTMEEQLSEDQAAVYSALTDQDREKIQDIEELREAIKQEATELELQLSDLAHHYDDKLTMKMHRLLDEQSLLCSQLRVVPPGPGPGPAHCRTVATQCCLLPWPLLADTWDVGSAPHCPPQSAGVCPPKAKMDLVGFMHRLKESLHQSVNTDSME